MREYFFKMFNKKSPVRGRKITERERTAAASHERACLGSLAFSSEQGYRVADAESVGALWGRREC